MALCFAHTAAGYLAYEAVRPAGAHRPVRLLAAVALANAADLDFVPGILVGRPGMFHRGVTHTVAAVAVVGVGVMLAGWLAGRPRGAWGWVALWASVTYASHLLLDFFTIDRKPPYGGRFLWPFSDAYYISPVTPLPEIVVDGSGRRAFFASLVGPHTLPVWAQEVGVLVLAVAGVHALRAVVAWPAWRGIAEER
jgi:membrane-bound metal-dependent hydrolase YbcI (DUF457 family)